MQKFVRPVISTLSIALFMILALATGPDGSTNVEVFIEKCPAKPPAEDYLKINVTYVNKAGMPILASGSIFIVEQIVTDTIDCQFFTNQGVINFDTGPDGKFSYVSSSKYEHDNASDLFRIEVIMDRTQEYEECKAPVEVQKYNSATFNITCVGKKLSEL